MATTRKKTTKKKVAKKKTTKKRVMALVKISDTVIDHLCVQLITTHDRIEDICKDRKMPPNRTLYSWIARGQSEASNGVSIEDSLHVKLYWSYCVAMEWRANGMLEEAREIADDVNDDYKEVINKRGEKITVPDHDHINRAKLRVDTRIRLAEKYAPHKYGRQVASIQVNIDNRQQTAIYQSIVKKAEEKTRGLPADQLTKLQK